MTQTRSHIRDNTGDRIFSAVTTTITVLALIMALYPLYFIVIASFSSPEAISMGKVILLPSGFNTAAYRFVLTEPKIWNGYKNTILYTFVGTVFGTMVTLMAAYSLSRKDFAGRKVINMLLIFTMFFSGGLIPTYIVVSNLRLTNTPFVLMILGSVSVYNMIIARTFFQNSLPDELLDAAQIDGCGNARFFFAIVLPLSKAIIAVIALYYAVAHWNSYFNAMIYVSDQRLYPLQLILREILVLGQSLTNITDPSEVEALVERQKVAQIIKYVVIIISSLPVICVYPFLQKYFVQGVMIGSVKG
ncbi:carbohydrate ABC transporter permease [Ruminococcaceae bacterium OttesenSCG-928-L11]|nr:carbohydrate ABC transporter permease [Ruminococcaceae bacterium OttesenSCG-928-L11]